MNLAEAYEFTSKVMTENSLSENAKEGITSFLENAILFGKMTDLFSWNSFCNNFVIPYI